MPTQKIPRMSAGHRGIDSKGLCEEGILEMLQGPACRDGDYGDIQRSADQLRDGLESDPALPGSVQSAACRSLFDRQPMEGSCVVAMDCGPAVSAVVDISGDTGSARGRNQERNEAYIARPMHREPAARRCFEPLCRQSRDTPAPRVSSSAERLRVWRIVFRGDPSRWHNQRSRRDDKGLTGTGKRISHGIDRGAVAPRYAGGILKRIFLQ